MTDGEDLARAACRKACAADGELPCFEWWAELAAEGCFPPVWEPCEDCLIIAELAINWPDPLDPNAVVRPLL